MNAVIFHMDICEDAYRTYGCVYLCVCVCVCVRVRGWGKKQNDTRTGFLFFDECQLRENKVIDLNVFIDITRTSPGDTSTERVSLYINKSCLFSEINLTLICRLSLSVSAKKTETVCNVYLSPSQDAFFLQIWN